MFQLQVASTDITNGNLAVAWCVDAELLKELADASITDPQVVIVIAPTENYHVSKEYRKVVPLKDLMTYVEFKVSGPNKIWAYVSGRETKRLRNSLLSKEDGQFITNILTQDSSNLVGFTTLDKSLFCAEPISVNVPKGVFAAEPAKWEKTWVNHWFRSKPQDQCDFRRRRFLAYTVQPVVILLDVVVRLVMLLFSTLWFSEGMSLKYAMHPLRYTISDATEVVRGGSRVIPFLPEDCHPHEAKITLSYVIRKLWKVPLMPVVFIPLFLIYHFHLMYVLSFTIGWTVLIFGLTFLFASLGAISLFFSKIVRWLTARQEAADPWYMNQEEIQTIICSPDMKNHTKLSALPKKNRTVSLYFQDLKARVCRPFSS